jgi:C1A family cysteine protease
MIKVYKRRNHSKNELLFIEKKNIMMKYLKFVLSFCLIGYVTSSQSVQNYVDNLLSNMDNKIEYIENNPILVNRIYRYFEGQYPRENLNKMIDFKQSERIEIFKSNLKYVIQHNDNPSNTFKLKINELSDWTDEERDQLRAKINVEPINNEQPIESRDEIILPSEYDWTNQTRVPNAVTPIKNQRHCGSCYAFAMVGALEKTYAQIYNQSGPLSPQQLIDCSDENGCEGGSFVGTFNYIKRNHDRLSLEKDYPSTTDGAKQDKCLNTNETLLSFNSTTTLRYQQLPTENEEYMKKVLFQQGPIYVYFNCGLRQGNDTILREASNKFDHYASGVFDVPGCPTHRNMNHALVVVGYGTENGTDYWKVKNSWGASYGENGFIKIKRNDNMCGIATWPYYAGLF